VRIQLFGDSTMHGYDGAQLALAVHTPRVNLQAYFDSLYPGKVLVMDRSVPGTTSGQLVAGTDGLNRPWPQDVNAEIVVINHGINDRNHVNDLELYRSNLLKLSQAPALVVWQTPNIVKNFDVGPYAQAMRELAAKKGQPLADVYAYTSTLPNWQTLTPDAIHPNDELYQMIDRDVVAPVLKPMVAALLCR
jgi:lysophospholipase L1-like esterase